MKIDFPGGDTTRPSVAGAIGNDEAILARERLELPIEGVDLVAPAAVQHDDRMPRSGVAVMKAHRRDAGRKRRREDLDGRHETPMLS